MDGSLEQSSERIIAISLTFGNMIKWQQLGDLFVFLLFVALKKRIHSNLCILSCFVWLKSVLYNILRVFDHDLKKKI